MLRPSGGGTRHINRRFFCLGTTALGLGAPLGLAACAPNAPLTVAFHPWPGYAPLELARQMDWWPADRLRALPTASASASAQAVLEGQAQAAALTLDEALRLHAQTPLAVVAVFNESQGADVVLGRANATGAPPPKAGGMRVGVETGAVGELMLNAWLDTLGFGPTTVTPVHLTPDAHEAAWQRGDLDAIVTYEPVASRLQARGAQRWFDSSQLPADTPIVDVLVVRQDALGRQADALATLVNSLFAGQRHSHQLAMDSAYRLAPWLGLPREQVQTSYKGVNLTGWIDNRAWLAGPEPRLPKAVAGLSAWLRRRGLLHEPPRTPLAAEARFLPLEEPA